MANDLNRVISVTLKIIGDNKGQLTAAVNGYKKLADTLVAVDKAAKRAQKNVQTLNKHLGKTASLLRSWGEASTVVTKVKNDLGSVAAAATKTNTAFSGFNKGTVSVQKTGKSVNRLALAMSIVNRRMSTTNLTLSKMGYALGVASSGLSQINAKLSGVTRGLSAIRAGIATITGFSTAFLALFAIKGTIRQLADFDDALRSAGAAAGASSAQLEEMELTIRNLGATTRFTSKEVADVAKQLSLAGFTVPETLKALPGVLQLAAAGMIDVGTAADIATNVLRGYGMQVDQLTRVNDVLVAGFTNSNTTLTELGNAFTYVGPIAHAAGMAFEETAAVLAALAQSGYKSTKAGVVLRNGIVRLLAPTRKAAKVISELGVATKKSDGSMRSMINIIDDLISSGVTVTDLVTIFGRRAGPGMAALISRGTKSLRDFNNIMKTSGGTARAVAEYMESGFGGTLRRLKSIWQELAITFGRMIEPDLVRFFSDLTVAMRENRTQIARFGKEVFNVLGALVQFGAWVVKTAHDFPMLTASLVGVGLGLPVLLKLAGVMGELKAIGMANTFKELMALKYGPMVAGFTSMKNGLLGIGAALRSLFALIISSPIGIMIATLTLAAAAVAILHKSIDDLVDSHLRQAEAYKSMRTEYTQQIKDLENLNQIFGTAEEGSAAWYDAEKKLARLVPGVNTTISEQGDVLAKVGEDYLDNQGKLLDYVASLRGARFEVFTLQLKELGTAVVNAGKKYRSAIDDFKKAKDIKSVLGPLMVLFGDYGGKLSKSMKESQLALARATKDLDRFAFEAVKNGQSIEEVYAALDFADIEVPEVREAVIKSYEKYNKVVQSGIKFNNKLQADQIAAYSASQLLSQQRFEASKQFNLNDKAALKKHLRDIKILEAKGVLDHEQAETRKMEITMQLYSEMLDRTGRAFTEMANKNMDTTEVEKAFNEQSKSFSQAQLAFLDQYLSKKNSLIEKAAEVEAKIHDESRQSVVKITDLKNAAYDKEVEYKRTTNDKIKQLEQSLADKIKAIVEKRNEQIQNLEKKRLELEQGAAGKIAGVTESLNDKLRSVSQRGMDEAAKDISNREAAEGKLLRGAELVADAKRDGDKAALTRGQALIQQAGGLFQSLQDVGSAYSGLRRAAEAEKTAIQAGLAIELQALDEKELKIRKDAQKKIDIATTVSERKIQLANIEYQANIKNTEKKLTADLTAENLRHAKVMANLSQEGLKYAKDLQVAKDRITKILEYTPSVAAPELSNPMSQDDISLIRQAEKSAASYARDMNAAEAAWSDQQKHVDDLNKVNVAATQLKNTLLDTVKRGQLLSPEAVTQASAGLNTLEGKLRSIKTTSQDSLASGMTQAAREADVMSTKMDESKQSTIATTRSITEANGKMSQVHDTVRQIDGVWTNIWVDTKQQVEEVAAGVTQVKDDLVSVGEGFGNEIAKAKQGTTDIKEQVVLINGEWIRTFSNATEGARYMTSTLQTGMQRAVDKYAEIADKHVKVFVDFVQKKAAGGLVQGFAAGGQVAAGAFRRLASPFINRGSGTKDDVPAMLKRNEFVMRPEAVKHYGLDFLYGLNSRSVRKSMLPHFSLGGLVTTLQSGLRSMVPHMASGGLASAASGLGGISNLGTVRIGVGNTGYQVMGDITVLNSLKRAVTKEGLMRGQ